MFVFSIPLLGSFLLLSPFFPSSVFSFLSSFLQQRLLYNLLVTVISPGIQRIEYGPWLKDHLICREDQHGNQWIPTLVYGLRPSSVWPLTHLSIFSPSLFWCCTPNLTRLGEIPVLFLPLVSICSCSGTLWLALHHPSDFNLNVSSQEVKFKSPC